jgi:hypothetical protein
MAIVIGPLHSSEARGRVGGLIYNTHRGKAVVRVKVAPSQPQSEQQLLVRSRAVFLSREWATLSDAQRTTWNDYAENHLDTDWTGNPKRISGFNWYIRCNMALLAMGGTILTSAPVTSAPDAPTNFVCSFATPSIDVSWDAYAGTDISVDIWKVGPGSGGSQLPIEDGRHNQYASGETAAAEIANLQSGFYRIFARAVDETSGLTSPWVSDVVEVT